METSNKPAQKPRKHRTESEKVGRIKYLIELVKQGNKELASLNRRVNRIEGYRKRDLDFVRSDIEDVCVDEVDREIVRLLFEVGDSGLLPRVIAQRLESFKVTRFQVARRINRMNKQLQEQLGERLFEQRGWHWALSHFAFDAWGAGGEKVEEAETESALGAEEDAWK